MRKILLLINLFLFSNLFGDDFQFLPERFRNNIVYFNDFEKKDAKGKINLWGIEEKINLSRIVSDNVFGKCYLTSLKLPPKTGEPDETIILKSDKILFYKGLTFSFWWRFKNEKNFPFVLFSLGMFSGIITNENFGQINFNLRNIKPIIGKFSVNPYNREIKNTLITISAGGLEIKMYQNSQLVLDLISPRPMNEKDIFNQITIGYQGKTEILIDEILIMDRPINLLEVKDYYERKKCYYENEIIKGGRK
ncbi:MAG TPA: hypothetical protein PKV21_06615 [bacterium]|nr:hypothetical protein [bacterium]HOM27162.1 hypothetical protein [bacterium]